MQDEIRNHLNDPAQLEKLYRSQKASFKRAFNTLYPEVKGVAAADFWHERLNSENEEINWGTGKELIYVIIGALIAGLIAKIPAIFNINEDYFYPRNIGLIVFPVLTIYFGWKNHLQPRKIAIALGGMVAGCIYINMLPDNKSSDTLVLACIHLAFFLWAILGFIFTRGEAKNNERRLGFLKYNGDLVVMTALILIAGGIMTGITIGLFSIIGFNIEKFYFDYIAIFGFAAAPIIGTYLTQSNPQLVGKVSPVIAKLFSPLVLVMLVIYLVAIVFSGKDPYNDREFLMIFNALLIGVMAIIFFSVAETSKDAKNRAQVWVLTLLSAVTIIVNCVALSAILFRIVEMGITPNRMAVMGGNLLILINLILVTFQLFKAVTKRSEIKLVGDTISAYLPVYVIWTIIVTFLFPLVFGFS